MWAESIHKQEYKIITVIISETYLQMQKIIIKRCVGRTRDLRKREVGLNL
jgi:hypothetical protein